MSITKGARPPSSYTYALSHSSNTDPSTSMENIQKTSSSLPPASHSSTTIDSALSQSTFYSSTYVPPKGSKGDHSASRSQTSLSPLARAGARAPTSSSSSSKTKFLKAIFNRKRKDSKQASQGSLSTVGRLSQASSSGSQTRPSATGSSSQKKSDSAQQQQPLTSFADLAYRYGSPSFKSPRL